MAKNHSEEQAAKQTGPNLGKLLKLLLNWRVLIGVAALGLVWWAVRDVPWQEVADLIQDLTFVQILILVVINLAILACFGMRIWVLLKSRNQPAPFLKLVAYWLAGFAFSFFTPGPQLSGAPLQIYLLHKDNSLKLSAATAAVTVSKVLEGITNATFLFIALLSILNLGVFPSGTSQGVGVFSLSLLVLTGGYLVLTYRNHQPATSALNLAPQRLKSQEDYQRLKSALYEAEVSIGEFFREEPLAVALGLLASIWITILIILQVWLAARFLGAQLNLQQVIVVILAVQLAILFPSPGGVGALEAALVLVFERMGYSASQAVTFTLLLRIRDLILGAAGLLTGGWSMLRKGGKPLESVLPTETSVEPVQSEKSN